MPHASRSLSSLWVQRLRPYRWKQRRVGVLLLGLGVICVALIGLSPTTPPSDPTAPAVAESTAIALSPSMPAWKLPSTIIPGAVALPYQDPKRHPSAPSVYDQRMAIGYRAYRNQDYHTALINFNRALEEKAGDPLATEAIRNTTAILQHQRGPAPATTAPPPPAAGAGQ